MDNLIERFGKPKFSIWELPYHWEQILGFVDECQALVDDWEASQTFDLATAYQRLEMIEFMASLCRNDPVRYHDESPKVNSIRRTMESVTNMTTRMRQCIFDLSGLPELAFRGICQHCNRVLRQALHRGVDSVAGGLYEEYLIAVDTWPNLPTLKTKFKSSGCQVCGLLKDSLQLLGVSENNTYEPYEPRVTLWFHRVQSDVVGDPASSDDSNVGEEENDHNGQRQKAMLLHILVKGHDGILPSKAICTFSLNTTSEALCQQVPLMRPPLPTCLSVTSVAFIQKALFDPEAPKLDRTYRPRRLLYLVPSQCSTPRIVELPPGIGSNDEFTGFQYAALSYCWGTPEQAQKQLTLTTKSRASLYSGIAEADMTPIIKDAMTVCRALNIRYLWVDALCILQGSGGASDWEEQSFEMSRIFGNAWITICTPASASCLDGFLGNVDRQSPWAQFEWSLEESPPEDSATLQLRLLTTDGKPDLHWPSQRLRSPLELDLERSAWNSRGWVFQERILSPKKVFFGSKMVHVQNNDMISSENGYRSISRFAGRGLYDNSGTCLSRELIQSKGDFVSDFWYSIIEPFPRKVFTNKSDILPALSGVARMFSEVTGHTYMAGLWKEDLHCGLLWTREDPDFRSLEQLVLALKNPTVIAPSWSWVNKPSFEKFMITPHSLERCQMRRHLKPEFSLLSSKYMVQGDNPLGRLMQASITIRARTIHARTYQIRRGPMNWVWEKRRASVAIRFDWKQDHSMSRLHWSRLRLLLIASCCSNTARTCWECGESVSNPNPGPLKCSKCGYDFTGDQVTGLGDIRRNFFEDGEPSFDPAVDCSSCADKKVRRDVWGLVIFSIGKANIRWYRVGTFISRAVHGGSDIFKSLEYREIVLI